MFLVPVDPCVEIHLILVKWVGISELLSDFVVLETHHLVELLVHGIFLNGLSLALLGHLVPVHCVPIAELDLILLHVSGEENLLFDRLLHVLFAHANYVSLKQTVPLIIKNSSLGVEKPHLAPYNDEEVL